MGTAPRRTVEGVVVDDAHPIWLVIYVEGERHFIGKNEIETAGLKVGDVCQIEVAWHHIAFGSVRKVE